MFNIDALFEQCMALRCEVKSLRHTVKEFKSGERKDMAGIDEEEEQ